MKQEFVPLNEKIKKLRLISGKKQEEVAKELSVTRSCLSNYELGIREPDLFMLKKMAELFDVEVSYFLNDCKFTMEMNEADRREYVRLQGKVRSIKSSISTKEMSLTSRIALHSFHEYLSYCDGCAKVSEKSGTHYE